jgi:hypothetical protein
MYLKLWYSISLDDNYDIIINDINTRVESKISILNDALSNIFEASLNLARIKFISLFIIAHSKVQTVHFEKLAVGFENNAKTFSSLRRIQRFSAHYYLDTDIIARLIFALLPHQPTTF